MCSKIYDNIPNIKQGTQRASPSRTPTAKLARSTESAEPEQEPRRSRRQSSTKGLEEVFPTEEAVAQATDVRAQGSTTALPSPPQRSAEVWRETKLDTVSQRGSTSNPTMSGRRSRTVYGAMTQVLCVTKTMPGKSVGGCRVQIEDGGLMKEDHAGITPDLPPDYLVGVNFTFTDKAALDPTS